ncbi:GNAT family N-acetyltransferase [Guptibacillus algicola]|uniref:GNAT family N-acetyltransferase n=1 Tax=Guptibacillus algicola TaxID=225844 RepID=UPI001CD54A06|nr:GNAT family N-acetyltransferase [Alkalihalobacillus algicola]MCA0987345.1 GNAT family N-acetyltransferase [Alkalihalobacillus algicola]
MITFVKSDGPSDVEKDIFNTNPAYNVIAFDKEKLDESDLMQQYREVEAFNTERYFIKKNDSTIGIIEYGMESPRSGKPWLSLLLIDGRDQGRGYAKKVFAMYENMMKEKNADIIQIAVHAENTHGLRFWRSLGFEIYDERVYEGKQYYSLDKKLAGL